MLAAEAAAVMAALAEVVVEAAGAVPVAESGGTCGGEWWYLWRRPDCRAGPV